MTEQLEKNIEAAEMWFWRRMLRLSWTEKKSTEDRLTTAIKGRSCTESGKSTQNV